MNFDNKWPGFKYLVFHKTLKACCEVNFWARKYLKYILESWYWDKFFIINEDITLVVKKWLKSAKKWKKWKNGHSLNFSTFFHFFRCERYIWLTENVLTFLEMGDHILQDYAIKNGGYIWLMQNKIVLKFGNAIFFPILPQFFEILKPFWSEFFWFDTYSY